MYDLQLPLSAILRYYSCSTVRNLCLAWSSKQFEHSTNKLMTLTRSRFIPRGDKLTVLGSRKKKRSASLFSRCFSGIRLDYMAFFLSACLADEKLFPECLYFALRGPRRPLSRWGDKRDLLAR
jgi:hypothetical protein